MVEAAPRSSALRELALKAKALRRESAQAQSSASQQATQFKNSHFLVVLFFVWVFLLQCIGIFLFTKGFLLTRLVLDHKSECSNPPVHLDDHGECWYPKTFDKAVVIIIDALRYDFTIPTDEQQHYLNALTVCHETAAKHPEHAFLLPFIADPPTSTLQRLKALTTGTLPTFIEVGSNFAGEAIEEDNLVAQLLAQDKTVVHLGDDTWESLFPGYFAPNLSHPFDSFDVPDLHTVDNGVQRHLFPLLEGTDHWDVIFGHCLGVDHIGHRYGPDHSQMTAKLQQMDKMIRDAMAAIDDSTLLVVMGDHGMDVKGDHGGESDDEVQAALWMYSKKSVFGRTSPDEALPPINAKIRPVNQIDLVPTLALLLGLPIPFNNLGTPIAEAFIGSSGRDWKELASAQALAASQIRNYQVEYEKVRDLSEDDTSMPRQYWNAASEAWNRSTPMTGKTDFYKEASVAFTAYQRENLDMCKSLWARFDIPSMIAGVLILAASLILLYLFSRPAPVDKTRLIPLSLANAGIGVFVGVPVGYAVHFFVVGSTSLNSVLLGGAAGSLVANSFVFSPLMSLTALTKPHTLWGMLSFIFTISQAAGFASNSYTIWEDEILLFFLGTFAILSLASSLRLSSTTDRVVSIYHSAIFLVLTRVASLSRLCRDEQMPACRSTYYASAQASTSATWQLAIPLVVASLFPSVIKSFYRSSRSFHNSAPLWVDVVFRLGLFGAATYWALDAADNGNWLNIDTETMRTIKTTIAQAVLGLAFAAGMSTFAYAGPCVKVEAPQEQPQSTEPNTKPVILVHGYGNAHGARYALLVTVWLLAVALTQKPMGNGSIALMVWQTFSLFEIIATNRLQRRSIGPIILAMLGNYFFFKTGHQATLASIQWDSAFLAAKSSRHLLSPVLVTLNEFGPQIIAVIAVPLVVFWKAPATKRGLLSDIARAMAQFILYHAVINLATTMWAGHLRRHLMLYRIFCPRFMTGAAVLVVVELVGILVALIGVRLNMVSIADTFGWS